MMITQLFKLFLFHCHGLFCNNNISIHTLRVSLLTRHTTGTSSFRSRSGPSSKYSLSPSLSYYHHLLSPSRSNSDSVAVSQLVVVVGGRISFACRPLFSISQFLCLSFEERPLKKSITVIHLVMNNSVDILIQFVRWIHFCLFFLSTPTEYKS